MPRDEHRRKYRFPTMFTVLVGVFPLISPSSFVVWSGRCEIDRGDIP
jgi:hypothetical protein